MFSPCDRTKILNQLAWQLIEGTLHVGDTWQATYDGGLATASFRLDTPGDREELEAFGIASGAVVLSLPAGRCRPPSAQVGSSVR